MEIAKDENLVFQSSNNLQNCKFWGLGLKYCVPFIVNCWWWIENMHINHVGKKMQKRFEINE
jgi:hypothetical protein